MVNMLPLILNFQAFVFIIIIKLPTFDPKIQTSFKIIQEYTLNNYYDCTKTLLLTYKKTHTHQCKTNSYHAPLSI